ncbi:MAG: ATP-binding protein [Dolichospermum sp.]
MNNINPYIIGRSIKIDEQEKFFGREKLFKFIEDNLESDQKTILLSGQRRIGKSSVLSQISNFIPRDKYFLVIFDLLDKSNLELIDVLYELAKKIIESLDLSDHEILSPLTSITDFFDGFLLEIYPILRNRNLVLLLDEFDAFPQGNKFLELIRNQGNKIFCIPVLGRNIDDTNNLLAHFRDAPKQEIGLLDFEESANLITTPSQGVLTYTSDAITAIWELAAGHPYFTQIICFSVFTQARKNNIWVVDRSEVQNIIAKAIETSEAGLAWVLNALSIREKVLFLAVAKWQESEFESSDLTVMVLEQYGVLRTNRPERAVRKLVEWRFLEEIRNSNSSTYKVTIELVRLWLLNKYSLEELIYENENAHRNPYNVGKPVEPEYFIGRKEELQIVLDQIRNSSHWVFYGSRAMGKTSFLKYLAAPTTWQSASYLLLSNYFFVYHDCNTIDNFTFSNFWKEILDKLKGMEKTDFMRSKISQFLTESDLNKNDVRQILQQIKDQGKFLVLLLDNYDRIFDQNHDNQEILKFIKNLEYLKELGNPLSIIMAASKNLSEIASIDVRDYLLYPSQSLKKFGDLEIVQLWDRMPDLLKNREDLRRTAQEITGGYPALIQMLCFSLYNHHSINGEETVTSTPELLKSDFNNRAEQTLQSIWESLNDRQKILLTLIALYHVGGKIDSINYNTSDIRNILTGSKHRSNLEILKTSGIILLDNVELKNNASVMQEWIIRKIANGDLEEVVEREQIFFGMTRRQLNNFRNGIRFIGENIEIVRNVAGGFSTILDLFV